MNPEVAIVEKYPSQYCFDAVFPFDFDKHSLVANKKDKILKKDITLDIDEIKNNYKYIIVVGKEPAKFVAGVNSVTEYQGYLVEDKFLPLINPAAVTMRPSLKSGFDKALSDIINTVNDEGVAPIADFNVRGIQDSILIHEYLLDLYDRVIAGEINTIAMDTETTALYPRDGYVLGISISVEKEEGVYLDSLFIEEASVRLLQSIINLVTVVFHNAKFDIKMLTYHFGLVFPNWEDTLLMHYTLDETVASHGLKDLAIKYTNLGDYDAPLKDFKTNYCRSHGIRVGDFTYDLIPFDILYPYAALDTAATIELYYIFKDALSNNPKLIKVYKQLLKKGTTFLTAVEENGIPLNRQYVKDSIESISVEIDELTASLYSWEEIKKVESIKKALFNVNSTMHLRCLFFDVLGLSPIKFTEKGEPSTDAETLEHLSQFNELPELIKSIKQLKKIRSTYLEKFDIGMDMDDRLRTGFNLHTTTSGRLSSSGKVNAQQLPRDNKTPKRCIAAAVNYSIASQDLKTAEMYVAAVLSGDKNLQKVFTTGVDYHGFMAVHKFGLSCTANEVKDLFPDYRQQAKTVSFEILYKLNYREPVLENFPKLKAWLKEQENYIKSKGYIYSHFGRKRRLKDAFSSNREIAQHNVRSGINFLVQSVASDINLLAGIEMQEWIEENNYRNEMRIFGLVHDSILAEVHNDYLQLYREKLAEFTQKSRAGLTIPGCPIGLDFEVGDTYADVKAA